MWLEVHVQPGAPGAGGLERGRLNECPADSAPLMIGMHCGVEEDGMDAAVPAHVDEADQVAFLKRTDPGQAVSCQALNPRADRRAVMPKASACRRENTASSTGKRTCRVTVTITYDPLQGDSHDPACPLKSSCRSDLHVGVFRHRADRLDPEATLVLVDVVDDQFSRRSSSAWVKNADAIFKISFARRSSRFPRSSSAIRAASSVVVPGRTPSSILAWAT